MAKPQDFLDEIIRVNLKRFREEAGLTTAQVADLSDVPIDNLRRYENGATSSVPGAVLFALSKVYGRAVDDFFQREPAPAKRDEQPTFFLKTRPGVEVDDELYDRIQDMIDKANREARGKKNRK